MAVNVGDAVIKLGLDKTKFDQDFNKLESNLTTKLNNIGRKMTLGLTLPLIGIGTAAFKMAGDFDQALRQVNVMLGASAEELDDYKKKIIDLSNATGKSAIDITNAFYQIVSAGFRGADAIDILTIAIQGAVGGAADATSTTEALTKAMNIFQLQGVEGASRAMDVFFGIVDTGLLTFEEMANAFPRAATMAAGLGVSIEETGAALGTLSKVTGSTEQASTALNAIFTQLIKPSEALQALYAEWGVKTGPEAIEKFGGLQGILQKITETSGNLASLELANELDEEREKAGKLADQITILKLKMTEYTDTTRESVKLKDKLKLEELEGQYADITDRIEKLNQAQLDFNEAGEGGVDVLAELFPNVEAIRGILPLTTTNTEDFAEALDTVTNSQGRANDAFEEMTEGPGFQWKQMMTTLKNSMITLGDAIARTLGPYIQKLIDWIQGAVDWFSDLDEGTQGVIVRMGGLALALGPALLIGGQLFTAIKNLIGVFTTLKGVLIATKIEAIAMWGAITMGIAAAIYGIEEYTRAAMKVPEYKWYHKLLPILFPMLPTTTVIDLLKKLTGSPEVQIPGMAEGAIAMRPITTRIAEREPEGVIPLSKLGMVGTRVVNIHVGSFLGDEVAFRQFARKLEQVLDEEGRRNAFGQVQGGYFYGRSSL